MRRLWEWLSGLPFGVVRAVNETTCDASEVLPDWPVVQWLAHRMLWVLAVSSLVLEVKYGAVLVGGERQPVARVLGGVWVRFPNAVLLVSTLLLQARHSRRLCEACFKATPVDVTGYVERRRWRFRAVHVVVDQPRRVVAVVAALLVGGPVLDAASPRVGAGLAVVVQPVVVSALALAGWHVKFQPWCPWCRGPGGPRERAPIAPSPVAA